MTDNNTSAYIPPATCKSCQKRLAPLRKFIFRLFFNAFRVRGHQMMIPDTKTKMNIRVLMPTMVFPQIPCRLRDGYPVANDVTKTWL